MVSAISFGAALIGVAIGIGLIGDLSQASRIYAGFATVFLSFFGFYHGIHDRKPIHIDISGKGHLRLTKVAVTAPCTDKNWPHLDEIGDTAQLINSSTLLPYLLLLRLQTDKGITVIPILPDSVSRDNFRALSVACRWIAVQGDRQEQRL